MWWLYRKNDKKPNIHFFKSFLNEKAIEVLKELLNMIFRYKVNKEDVFYEEKEMMKKMFLNNYFESGGTIGDLEENKGNYFGIYILVLPSDFGKIEFSKNHYKAKCKKKGKEENLNYPLNDLEQKWVNDAKVLYIGKSESKFVQKRMKEHIRLYTWDENHNGYNNVPARGGRSIGQIQNFKNLEVLYLKTDKPKEKEKELIRLFKEQYNKLPFANRRN